ncbi:MAG TPA: DEAD/DEAH box helicase, partial [Kiritimatiellia bacterium]|nr:DEAD/DEAH box helicase [Kiritimatiellia bacterium]
MSSNAVSCVRHLIDEYRRFLRSTYRLADEKLRKQFEGHIDQTEVIVKGPYVTLARDFARDRTLQDLLKVGTGHPDLAKLHWPFGGNPLFKHQEKALHLVDIEHQNCVIKTGTGSGKTEAFLLAVLSGVMRMREQGIRGTKAILLYPMNALANDQLMRLRDIIRDSGLGLTFAMYTGDSETVAQSIGTPVEGNEFTARAKI